MGCLGSSPSKFLLKGLFPHQVVPQLPKKSSSYPCMASLLPFPSVSFEGKHLQSWTAVRGALCATNRLALKPHLLSVLSPGSMQTQICHLPWKVLALTWYPKMQLLSNCQTKCLHSKKEHFLGKDLNKTFKIIFSLVQGKTCYHIRN